MLNSKKGFTLIEMMVVVAIIAILAGAASIGLKSFSATVSIKNAGSLLGDIIQEISTEAVLKDYEKTSIYFNSFHLLADSKMPSATMMLTWAPVIVPSDGCRTGDIKLTSSADAQLFERNKEGNSLGTPITLTQGGSTCINPVKYQEREIVYQLQTDTAFSNKIRIFPVNPDFTGTNVVVVVGNRYRLDILQPYGQKKLYNNNVLVEKGATSQLTIENMNDNSEEVTFDLPKT